MERRNLMKSLIGLAGIAAIPVTDIEKIFWTPRKTIFIPMPIPADYGLEAHALLDYYWEHDIEYCRKEASAHLEVMLKIEEETGPQRMTLKLITAKDSMPSFTPYPCGQFNVLRVLHGEHAIRQFIGS